MALSTRRSGEDLLLALAGAARDAAAKLAQSASWAGALTAGAALSMLLLTPSGLLIRCVYRFPRHKGKNIPFVAPPNLLFGNLMPSRRPDEFAALCAQTGGSTGAVLFHFPFNFLPPLLLVTAQDHVKEVLGPRLTMASDRSVDAVSGPILGKALFAVSASTGDWKRQHRVCMRGFGSPHKLQEYAVHIDRRVGQFTAIVEGACAGEDLAASLGWRVGAARIKPAGPSGASLEIGKLWDSLTLRIVSDVTVCGSASVQELQEFQDDFETWIAGYFSGTLMVPLLKHLPLPSHRQFHRAEARMKSLVAAVIQRCRDSGLEGGSLVAELLKAGGEQPGSISDEEVSHNVFGFILAGMMTTADLLTSATFMLARHPEVQEALAAELAGTTGDLLAADTPLLDAVIHETLRLYPPSFMTLDRTVNTPMEVCDFSLTTPTMVAVNCIALQRQKVWGSDAHAFRPSRWTDGSVPQDVKDNYFMPFGAGVRHCIGKNMSLLESRAALAGLVRTMRVRELQPERFRMELFPRLSVAPGLAVVVERR